MSDEPCLSSSFPPYMEEQVGITNLLGNPPNNILTNTIRMDSIAPSKTKVYPPFTYLGPITASMIQLYPTVRGFRKNKRKMITVKKYLIWNRLKCVIINLT